MLPLDLRDPASAYVFGFMQADGHHCAGRGQKGSVTIEIKARDADLLRAMQQVIPWKASVRLRTRKTNFAESAEFAILTLCALEGRLRLLELGLPVRRKSAVIAPPIEPFSHSDYLRGLFDADGSVGFTSGGMPFLSIVTASLEIAEFARAEIERITGVRRTVRPNKRDGVVNLMVGSDPAATLARWLYGDACIAMARKQAAGLAVAAWKRPEGMRARSEPQRWTPAEDAVVLRMSQGEAARELGRTVRSVNMRRWRLGLAGGEPHEARGGGTDPLERHGDV
jgi:LAGLIDADG-like domain